MNLRRDLKTLLFVFSLFLLLAMGINANASVKTYNQKGYALKGGYATHFVNNGNYAYIPKYSYGASEGYYENATYQTSSYTMNAKGGNFRRNAKTSFYLPVTYNTSGDLGNPQSVAISKSGQYAYVMYPFAKNTIVRYDLWKLHSLGVDTNNMAQLRLGLRSRDPQIMSAIKFGPYFNAGHGQSLALNPKTNMLWYVKMDVVAKSAALVEVSPTTLKPVKQINFKFSPSYSINNELAIDNNGNFYTYVKYRMQGKSAGRIVIFKGQVKNNHVSFRAIKQGLANGQGFQTQGMGYNPASNRLYFVSDGVISSVPVNKLNKLRPRDVRTTKFKTNLEFEGIAFNQAGLGYILTIRGSQLFTINNF
ncbi:hypothetical protein AKUH4B507X_00090 [Apilactobacillus kunkeei]|nr:hypothetical protein AKUH3B102A_00090 [Apilactobacillus kunkeei]CAI2547621.1 hypothetical protein AKUH3B109M_00090 [Apilactobacillus kunkeei]CAI2547777.1 hypothetical protein AKUH3B205J_00090 [Apilactobacillus kunkeei]CAI2547779.1 hypothetical protein AKUH3B208X_00090 [Apilactobacillus kunkeei]CAI2547816.1 hypothetical protein AKUH3B101A_00090 [Apilactobacillus kunkeei]